MTEQEFSKRYSFHPTSDKIGVGAFGTVYKAYDTSLDKVVAIKIAEVKEIGGKEFSLLEEFEAIKNLEPFKNIANYEEVHRILSISGLHDYAVMQYYPLGNLSEYLKNNQLTIQEKESLIIGILDGIAFLHKNKIIHRDLKPSNIMVVDRKGKLIPKISDFGLSKQEINSKVSSFTNSFIGGTLQYSSPEQLNGKSLKMNTDLWSLGTIIYEIFTGYTLFEADEQNTNTAEWQNAITQKILNQDISNKLKKLPRKWQSVTKVCLKKGQKERIKDTKHIYKLLNKNIPDFLDLFNVNNKDENTLIENTLINASNVYSESKTPTINNEKLKIKSLNNIASRWRRILAYWLDIIFIGFISQIIVCLMILLFLDYLDSYEELFNYGQLKNINFSIIYISAVTFLPISETIWGKTFGKYILKLKVISKYDHPLKLKHYLTRFLLHPINLYFILFLITDILLISIKSGMGIIFGGMFFLVVIIEIIKVISKKRSLADVLSKTLVVDK